MKSVTLPDALTLIAARYGRDILLDGGRLTALLYDISPKLTVERNILKAALTPDTTKKFTDVGTGANAKPETLIPNLVIKLWHDFGMNKDLSEDVLWTYAEALGVGNRPKPKTIPNPKTVTGTVFARWAPDGYYYPAVIEDIVNDDHAKIRFLDGTKDLVTLEHYVELSEAYKTMTFEADWEKKGGYYTCKIVSQPGQPLVVHYKDGINEQIDLIQLRASFPTWRKIQRVLQGKSLENIQQNSGGNCHE